MPNTSKKRWTNTRFWFFAILRNFLDFFHKKNHNRNVMNQMVYNSLCLQDLQDLQDPQNSLTIQGQDFQQLVFVFNAIMAGWKVKQLENNVFEFEKDLVEIPKKYLTNNGTDVKDTFLFKFLKNNLSLECTLPRQRENVFLGYQN